MTENEEDQNLTVSELVTFTYVAVVIISQLVGWWLNRRDEQ